MAPQRIAQNCAELRQNCAELRQNCARGVLDEAQLASVEDHRDLLVVEVELLVAAARPRHLRQLARLEVAQQHRLVRVADEEAVLEDVDLGDLVPELRLEDDPRACVRGCGV